MGAAPRGHQAGRGTGPIAAPGTKNRGEIDVSRDGTSGG